MQVESLASEPRRRFSEDQAAQQSLSPPGHREFPAPMKAAPTLCCSLDTQPTQRSRSRPVRHKVAATVSAAPAWRGSQEARGAQRSLSRLVRRDVLAALSPAPALCRSSLHPAEARSPHSASRSARASTLQARVRSPRREGSRLALPHRNASGTLSERKGCGAHPKTGPGTGRAAPRFARILWEPCALASGASCHSETNAG